LTPFVVKLTPAFDETFLQPVPAIMLYPAELASTTEKSSLNQ
jgi:hypothetical protein